MAIKNFAEVAGQKVTVSLATLMSVFPMYRDTIPNMRVGQVKVLKVGRDKYKVTRINQNDFTQEAM